MLLTPSFGVVEDLWIPRGRLSCGLEVFRDRIIYDELPDVAVAGFLPRILPDDRI